MPVFIFYCASCRTELRKLIRPGDPKVYCTCGTVDPMQRSLPQSLSTVTKEIKDPHRGVSHTKGLAQQLKKRMTQHHDSHEVAAKIDEHGIDDAKKHGWDKRMKRT